MPHTPHILLVDDEPNIVMSLDFLMRKAGYQVSVARNGTEALEAINHAPFDVIILDIMMPDVDGYQVCRHLRQRPDQPGTRVIFLSAKSREQDVERGYAAGADLYLTKPFSTRQLMEQVPGAAARCLIAVPFCRFALPAHAYARRRPQLRRRLRRQPPRPRRLLGRPGPPAGLAPRAAGPGACASSPAPVSSAGSGAGG